MSVMTTMMRTLPTTNKRASTPRRSRATLLLPHLSPLEMSRPRRSTSTPSISAHCPPQTSRSSLHHHPSFLTALPQALNAPVHLSAPATTHSTSTPSTANPSSSRKTSACHPQPPHQATASTRRMTFLQTPPTMSKVHSWAPRTCSSSTLACTAVLAMPSSMPAWMLGLKAIDQPDQRI